MKRDYNKRHLVFFSTQIGVNNDSLILHKKVVTKMCQQFSLKIRTLKKTFIHSTKIHTQHILWQKKVHFPYKMMLKRKALSKALSFVTFQIMI